MNEQAPALHIAPTPFFSDRGCHIRIRNEIEALAAQGIRVILCTYPLGDAPSGLDIRRPPRIPGYRKRQAGFSPYRILADFLLFFLALQTALRERPRILHGHLHEGALIGQLVRLCLFWRRMALVMDMQGSLTGELLGYGTLAKKGALYRLIWGVEWLIYRLPDVILCSSRQSMAVVREDFGGRNLAVELLADVVPDAFFREVSAAALRRELGLPEDKKILLYSGSLVAGKGLGRLFETMRAFRDRDDVFFLLIGYPVEEAEAFVVQENLAGRVRLTGRLSYDALAHWLPAADLALEPKEAAAAEASGKLLHYMAAGLAVACFDTANNRAMLGDAGWFAPPDGSLADAAQAALDAGLEERARRGAAGRERARGRYALDAAGRALRECYERLSAK